MSPPLWSQMSIVTSFLDDVIIPSFDPLKSIHCHSPNVQTLRKTWALIAVDYIIEAHVHIASIFEDLSKNFVTSISLEPYNVKKHILGQLFQEVRDHHHLCALYGGVHLRIAINQVYM